ncbi:MAG: hypothetical protein OIF48_14760 [Silicimonas sp.]|nr:hypothetical protein [Silicimonas sp.]
MKTGSVLGLIGGVIALGIGAAGYSASTALGSLSQSIGYGEGAASLQFYRIMSVLLPVLGLIGAGIAGKRAELGAGLMGAAAVGIIWSFGLGLMSMVPATLLAIGGFLIFADGQPGPYDTDRG